MSSQSENRMKGKITIQVKGNYIDSLIELKEERRQFQVMRPSFGQIINWMTPLEYMRYVQLTNALGKEKAEESMKHYYDLQHYIKEFQITFEVIDLFYYYDLEWGIV